MPQCNQIIPSKQITNESIDFHYYLSTAEIYAINHEVTIMGNAESASIEALKIVQKQRGWISDDSLIAIAQCLDVSSAQLEGVATFYNHIYRQAVGHYVIHLCNSISCHLNNYNDILAEISRHLGISYGQTTSDNQFTLLSNVCLGSCDKSPTMMINGKHYHSLTPNSAISILCNLSELEAEELADD